MLNIKALKQAVADNAAAQAALKHEGRTLSAIEVAKRTPEQVARLDAIDKEMDTLAAAAVGLTKELARAQKFAADEKAEAPVVVLGADLAATKPFASIGEQLQAIHRARTAGGRGDYHARLMAAAQGAGEAIDSDGGYLLQPDFKDVIESKMFEQGMVLSRCRQLACGPNSNGMTIKVLDDYSRATGSRWGGVRGYWVNEGSAPTASKPTFTKVELKLRKVACLGYASDELLEDATAMSSIFPQAFAEELTFLTENAIFNGTGAEEPTAIIGHAATVSVLKETSQTNTTIKAENVIKMWARLWARSRANACWCINQDCEPQLHTLSIAVGTAGGQLVYMPPGGLSGQPYGTIFGRPVIPVEYAATLGTVGDIMLCDFSQYGLLTKGGPKQASSMHVAFTTDEMAFRAVYRVDGQPLWKTVLTPFKGTSNTQSPFITLASRP